jgi:hypothetical protein
MSPTAASPGPIRGIDNPIGEGGMRLHAWTFAADARRAQRGHAQGEHGPDAEVVEEVFEGIGADIMGRKMFGGGDGPWTRRGPAGGARTRRTGAPSTCSPTTAATRCRCRAA